MQGTRASSLFFLSLPEFDRLVRTILTLDLPSHPGPHDDNRAQQILRCRELLFLNPEVLSAPLLNTTKNIIIVTSISFLKSGKIQGFVQRVKAKVQDVQRAMPAEVQMCLTYTLIARLAPGWNKVGDVLVQGRDFMMKTCKQNAVGLQVNVTDKQVCIAIDVFTVRLPPPALEDFDISTAVIQRFLASDFATISPASIFSRWCYVLPSMKKGEIVSVTHALLPKSSLQSYNDLRKHWKNMHGYRLPQEEQDRTIYCHINFKLLGERLFSYPLWSLRSDAVQFVGRGDHGGVLNTFLGDLHNRLPAMCGFPMRLTSSPLYCTPELSSVRLRETHSSQPVNLSSNPPPSYNSTPRFFSSQLQQSSIPLNLNLCEFAKMFANISSPVSTSPHSQQNRSITTAQQKPQSDDVAAKLTRTSSSSLTSSSTSSSSSPLQQRPKPQNGWVASSSQGQLGKPRMWQPGSGSAIMSATQPPSLLDKPRTLLGLPVFGANAGDAFLPIFKGGFKTSQRPAGRSEPPKRMNFMQHVLSGKDGGSGGGGAGCGGGDGGGEGGESSGRVEKPKLFVPTFSKVKKQPVNRTVPTMPDKPTRQQGGATSPANAVVTTKPIPASRPLPPSFTATTTASPDETVPTRDAVGPAAWQRLGLLPVGGASGRGLPPKLSTLTKPKVAPADCSTAAVKRKALAQVQDTEAKPKKSRPKPTVQQVNVEEMASSDQLSKVNAVTLLSWLKGRGVAARSADRKEELIRKVVASINSGKGKSNKGSNDSNSISKFFPEM
ncbi:uncharacterized protein C18orf63-like [Lethenteron reissneri]|uniref:uncharacterized protein C18orf63-like n=1 Tax=Lethenteron reissneri TaxID=7753 RepID=UPI002AB745AF|nr:uncharacterized protein C18orf63-like [Lethenteron reissneri]XP_061429141.1 uncharacterized protein C18orf63-like [Lethenteron reissneri]XP_061429142.1 uncharacterized protein C18orf63-like [Lethenteron reissneri]